MQRVRRFTVAATLALVGTLSIVAITAYLLSQAAPRWWEPIDLESPATARRADDLERAVGHQLTLVREPAASLSAVESWRSDDWTTSIQAGDANAWLNINLRDWLASDPNLPNWPGLIDSMRVRFIEDSIQVGVMTERGDHVRYLSATIRPHIDEEGSLWLEATSVSIGRLGIPAPVMLDRAGDRLAELVPHELEKQTRSLLRLLRGDEPVPHPIIRLGDGRQVRLVKILPRNGKLVVTCRTEVDGSGRASRSE
ncbi:MAG: hypothetical protein KJZ65_08445 [Phycisphaerales bacterium]|nr:hypothetical protein [Phycisphaerales bacterium]